MIGYIENANNCETKYVLPNCTAKKRVRIMQRTVRRYHLPGELVIFSPWKFIKWNSFLVLGSLVTGRQKKNNLGNTTYDKNKQTLPPVLGTSRLKPTATIIVSMMIRLSLLLFVFSFALKLLNICSLLIKYIISQITKRHKAFCCKLLRDYSINIHRGNYA